MSQSGHGFIDSICSCEWDGGHNQNMYDLPGTVLHSYVKIVTMEPGSYYSLT